MMRAGRGPALACVVLAAVLLIASAAWLSAMAPQEVPISIANDFIRHLQAGRFAQASRLTNRSRRVGTTAAELAGIAGRELCASPLHTAGTSPPQTHGNRLRRWLSRAEIEMPEVHVEFEGACLLRVTLRHSPGTGWQVSSFASHAG